MKKGVLHTPLIYQSLEAIAPLTVSSSLSSISVLVSFTAFSRITIQISINFSPRASLSGIFATESEMTFAASGRRMDSIRISGYPYLSSEGPLKAKLGSDAEVFVQVHFVSGDGCDLTICGEALAESNVYTNLT